MNKDHEIYRQWVALVNDQDEKMAGVTGYAKVSIRLLGPKDHPAVHNVAAEEAEERALAKKNGGNPIQMPDIHLELNFLVINFYSAEGLPAMDSNMLGTGIDAYVSVKFGSNPGFKTGVRKGTRAKREQASDPTPRYNVRWNQEMWVPVYVPTMSNTIRISVWDDDWKVGNVVGSDEIVATTKLLSFKDLTETPELMYLNLYGAVHPPPIGRTDQAKTLNTDPDSASHYQGRLLVSLRKDLNKGPRRLKSKLYLRQVKPKVSETQAAEIAETAEATVDFPIQQRYRMKAAVYAGSEMKEWFDVDNNRLSVEFTCGHEVHLSTAKESFTTSFSSKFGTVDGGTIFWQGVTQNQFVFANFPCDLSQVPDVFCYLRKGKDRIAFRRWTANDLIDSWETFATPQWWHLLPETVIGKFDDDVLGLKMNALDGQGGEPKQQFPGSLLLHLVLMPDGHKDADRAQAMFSQYENLPDAWPGGTKVITLYTAVLNSPSATF